MSLSEQLNSTSTLDSDPQPKECLITSSKRQSSTQAGGCARADIADHILACPAHELSDCTELRTAHSAPRQPDFHRGLRDEIPGPDGRTVEESVFFNVFSHFDSSARNIS